MTYRKHIFYCSAGKNIVTSTKNNIIPFNNTKISTAKVVIGSEEYNQSLYGKYMIEANKKDINSIPVSMKAISRLYAMRNHTDVENRGGYGLDGEGTFYCDYYEGQEEQFNDLIANKGRVTKQSRVIIQLKELKMKAVVVDKFGGTKQYVLKNENRQSEGYTSSAAICCLLAFLVMYSDAGLESNLSPIDKTIVEHYLDMEHDYLSGNDEEAIKKQIVLENDLYMLFCYTDQMLAVSSTYINPDFFTSQSITELVESDITKKIGVMQGSSDILEGQVNIFKATKEKTNMTKTVGDIVRAGDYLLNAPLKAYQKQRIPSMDRFIPSKEVIEAADEIKASIDDDVPCRNILWTGDTGTGKSTSAQLLAQCLGLNYESMNLSSDKMSSDIFQTYLPNTKKVSFEEYMNEVKQYPTVEDIIVDPAAAYYRITGNRKNDATEDDVLQEIRQRNYEYLSKNHGNDLISVESPLMKVIRDGGVCELQEVNSAKAGILKAMNELLDDLNIVHLQSGECVQRNKYAIIVCTANVGDGYEGINQFSNDFVARFHMAHTFHLPKEKEMVERIIQRSGYNNKDVIKRMLSVMDAIKKELKKETGNDGACSPRSVIQWARRTKHCNDPYAAALSTIISLSTQDPEIRENLIQKLEIEFKPRNL